MAQLDGKTPSATSPKEFALASRRRSKYASGGPLSKHGSVTSLTASRPAPSSPSSPASQTASRDASRRESLVPSLSRQHSQISDLTTQKVPSHKVSTSSMRRAASSNTPTGLMFTATRRLSGLFNTFTSDDLPDANGEMKAMDSPLERIGEGVATKQDASDATSSTVPLPNTAPTSNETLIRRNFSSTSASTSGSSSSTPSNPAARHASELAAAYADVGIFLPTQAATPTPAEVPASSPDEVIQGGNASIKSNKTITDMGDDGMEWHRQHPILVRDFAYEESDGRFSRVPIELMPLRQRSKFAASTSTPKNQARNKLGGFFGRSTHHGGLGAQYGARWDVEEDEDEDDDDWGFPMGTVSGGTQPLGTTKGGGLKSDLKNRSRAWGGLGARGVGGKYADVSQSEEDSSGFYEESGEDELSFGPRDGVEADRRPEDDDDDDEDYIANTQTPSNVRSHFDFLDVQPHPEADGLDGILGDEDDSPYNSDHPTSSQLHPGIYRVLFDFIPEGDNEWGVTEGQFVKVIGRGGGEGWAVVLKGWRIDAATDGADEKAEEEVNDAVAHGLVPESFLEVHLLDDDDDELI
jgi:hypothetical protein